MTLVSTSGDLQSFRLQEELPLEWAQVLCFLLGNSLYESSDGRVLQTFVMRASVACYLEEN